MMADKTAKRPLQVETEPERNRRHQDLLFAGAPMPKGWKLPPLTEPPGRSDPEAVRRAGREIASLKAARFEAWRRVPFDAGVAAEPGRKGEWGDMAEFGKLDVMQHWVNWQGVSRADRVGMMAAQLDLEKLPPELKEQLSKDAGLHAAGADRIEGQEIEATPHRVRPPSEIAREVRQQGSPSGRDTEQSKGTRPSEIARDRGSRAEGRASGQHHEKDHDR